MGIGERIRALRQQKKLSQAEIERRTGLIGSYISRIEHGHSVPSVWTLEKFARALEVPLYQLFYDGSNPVKFSTKNERRDLSTEWGSQGREATFLRELVHNLSRMSARDRALLMTLLYHMSTRKRSTPKTTSRK